MLVSMIALVIGSEGQDGRILISKLSHLGYRILSVSRRTAYFQSESIPFCDLSQINFAHQFLSAYQPDLIFHVAAVHGSSDTQASTIDTQSAAMRACHVEITQNVVSWLPSHPKTRFHVALSSQMYQVANLKGPVDESTPTDPQNFYGQTKSEAWDSIRASRDSQDLLVSASILFNHASRYSREEFVFSQIANQFVDVIERRKDTLSLRNPFATIDISSAFEICDAMILNTTHCPAEDFVLASGATSTLSEIIVRTASNLGVTKHFSDLDLIRHPSNLDIPPIVEANPRKAYELLGWKTKSSPEKILSEMIAHKLKGEKNSI
jgi:GDPmannose 4,6-dehydratase